MLTTEEKVFFASIARASGNLSSGKTRNGAILVKNKRILSYGFNKKIVPGQDWEISAVLDTLFGSRDIDFSGSDLFSTRFPNIDELKLIISAGVSNIFFTGDIDNIEDLQFAMSISESYNSFKIIKLE